MSEPRESRASGPRLFSTSDEELLALRLRVAELERTLAATSAELAARTALLDSKVGRGMRRAAQIRRALGADGAVAAGYNGSGAQGVRVPVAGLLATLESGSGATWTDEINVAGVSLGGVTADPPMTLTCRIRDRRNACVRAFAAVRPGAWMRNRGGVRFRIRLADTVGRVLAEVVRDVDPASRRADRCWIPLILGVPPGDAECDLTFSTELAPGADQDFSWAVWGDPVLLVARPGARAVPIPGLRATVRAAAAAFSRTGASRAPLPDVAAPLISILLPVHDPDPELLRQTLDSVIAQTSGRWELCIVDDGSSRDDVASLLEDAARDERVTLRRHDSAQGISAATNAALACARGVFVATLDHDDLLAPDAIAAVGARLAADPTIDVLYTDNDKVADGVRFSPSLKPGWSPELLRACMYTLHLSVYRRTLVEELGGWRTEFDGAQDHDLMLRLSERTNRIVHVPRTLYSWRAHAGSAALGDLAKPDAYDRGLAAVREHLARSGVDATGEALAIPGRYRVVYSPSRGERTAVVLPLCARVAGDTNLARHLSTIAAALTADCSEPPQLVVVAVEQTADVAETLGDAATVITVAAGPWGAMARAGIAATDAEALVLIEELCLPLTRGWLEELTGPLRLPDVCASSPLVIADDDRVVHAGVALLGGIPLPVHLGGDTTGDDVAPELTMVTDRSAAAGVVAVARAALAGADGPNPTLDYLALTAMTASLSRNGERVVCSPHVPWRVLGWPRPTHLDELRAFALEHTGRVDPYYNPRLWPDRAAHIVPQVLQQAATH